MGTLLGAAWGGRSLLMLLLRRHPEASFVSSSCFSSLVPRPPAPPAALFPSLGAPRTATPWSLRQTRGKARGNEYQPSNIKRKHKHGWIARIRTAGGVQVILRRMLKGRKSLTH